VAGTGPGTLILIEPERSPGTVTGRRRGGGREDGTVRDATDADAAPDALVLIVEDDRELARALELTVRAGGMRTERVADGRRALELWRAAAPDLVLLDLGLPGMDGSEVLRAVRAESRVPVVILTARAEEADELAGLGLGADDYLVKPVSGRKLVARLRAVLRRARPDGAAETERLRIGPLEIDLYRAEARVDGRRLPLTPSEFRLLAHLARTPGRAVERSELYEAALPEGEGFDRAVDVHVANLRRKLREAGADDRLETVRGIGYRLREGPP
jgi:DNA-binding response OmpR family regulator